MKRDSKKILIAASLAVSGLGFGASQSMAQVRTWTTTTPTGDTGVWSDSTKWGGNVPDVAGESAVFGGYANDRTVTVDNSTYVIDKLTITPRTTTFSAKAFTLNTSGGGTLQIGSGGIDIDNGGTVAFNAPIILSANQTWNALSNPAGNSTFSGVISGGFSINRTSTAGTSSVFTFSAANTFSGGYTQAALNNGTTRLGSSSTLSGNALLDGPLGIGTVTLNGGTLTSNSNAGPRTLQNNVVVGGNLTLGNSTNNSALTFSDASLTTPTTFTLGSVTTGNVTVLRTQNTALSFDQVIAESGGTGQSVNIATTTGTPSVAISRTKTAKGAIEFGGVNLTLSNGAAQSGSLVGVNGSVTVTGSNKLSSGSNYFDATSVIATDNSNYSAVAGGKASAYTNARVSFATDQSQVTVAGLFTSDSQVRLGLSSGSLSPTVTQSYNQSAIGNGKAGLVSASSGTVTYTGTLTSGSDNTFRVGGGLGTLSFTGTTLTGPSKNVSIEGGGTVNASAVQDYTGTTTVNSGLTLSGAAGALTATSGISINNGSLTLDNTTANANRLVNAAGVTLNRGTLAMNNSTTAIAETIGTLTINSGFNTVSMGTAAGAANTKSITTGTLSRTAGSVALFRGDNFGLAAGGGSALTRNLVIVSSAPSGSNFVGGGGANGTTNVSIIPWARTGAGTTASGGNFLTYDSSNNSLRPLITAEFATNVDTATNATDNVRQAIAASGTTTLLTANRTRNSFILQNAGATGAGVGSLGGFTLNVTSGAVDLSHTVAQNFTLNNGTLAFGSAEGVITNSGGSASATTLGAVVTGSGGVTFAANNGGILTIGGANLFTGGITVLANGNSIVGVSNDTNFGNSANAITHAGGELRFFTGFSSARDLSLLGNVGNNTLGNNTTSNAVTLTGNITGSGLLRLVNNASTAGTGGFVLSGAASTYSGGTQIEGISVSGTTDNALGTGTVTLIGANANVASLSLTSAAPVLGGLRGTDGSVTLTPTASAATLTVGGNNESTVYNGTIGQGAGKTVSLDKVGTGTLVLGGNLTYGGSTKVTGGTLNVVGRLVNNGPTNITLDNPDSTLTDNATLIRASVGTTSYVGLGATASGGLGSAASLLAGGNTTGTDTGVSMQFRQRTTPEATSSTTALISDVISLTGMANSGSGTGTTDLYVLQLSYSQVALATALSNPGLDETGEAAIGSANRINLGWLDTTSGDWVLATAGNSVAGGSFQGNVAYSGAYLALGNYGVDTANNVVWAVVDHNSQFAVTVAIPEPGTGIAFLAGISGLALSRRRRA